MGTTLRVMSIKKDFPLKLVYKMGYTLLKRYIEGPREYFKAGYPPREYLIYLFFSVALYGVLVL